MAISTTGDQAQPAPAPSWTEEDDKRLAELTERKKRHMEGVRAPLRRHIDSMLWTSGNRPLAVDTDKVTDKLMTDACIIRDLLAPLDRRTVAKDEDGALFRKLLNWANVFETHHDKVGGIHTLTFFRPEPSGGLTSADAQTLRTLIDSFPE